MGTTELLLFAVALSMDAFSVAICKGLSFDGEFKIKRAVKVGLYFGIFQALAPLLGYFLGGAFMKYIEAVDHWVAFILLLIIGLNMIKEAFSKNEKDVSSALDFKTMTALSVATSVDALAVGVALSSRNANIYYSAAVIGVTAFMFSFIGVKIGDIFGRKYKSKAETLGGLILIGLAFKFLLTG